MLLPRCTHISACRVSVPPCLVFALVETRHCRAFCDGAGPIARQNGSLFFFNLRQADLSLKKKEEEEEKWKHAQTEKADAYKIYGGDPRHFGKHERPQTSMSYP